MSKIVHVGLGKTGSTSLQKVIFPAVSRQLGLQYLDHSDERIAYLKSCVSLGVTPQQLDIPENAFVSCEGLSGWDPYFWDQNAELIYSALGRDCKIIITIREPSSYLTSVYLQRCCHEGDILSPQEFFLANDLYSSQINHPKFAVDYFSYSSLIDSYSSRFHSVCMVKYEIVNELDFFSSLGINIAASELELLRNQAKSVRGNVSYSERGVKWTLALFRLLSLFGVQLESGTIKRSREALESIQSFQLKAEQKDSICPPLVSSKFKKKNSRVKWRHFVQGVLDKWGTYKKFQLEYDNLKSVDLLSHQNEYRQLPSQMVCQSPYSEKTIYEPVS